MATRLHPDDAKGGQSNWADIDDDDEDWDPDTITWKDGTKVAIALTEEHNAPPPRASRPAGSEREWTRRKSQSASPWRIAIHQARCSWVWKGARAEGRAGEADSSREAPSSAYPS